MALYGKNKKRALTLKQLRLMAVDLSDAVTYTIDQIRDQRAAATRRHRNRLRRKKNVRKKTRK